MRTQMLIDGRWQDAGAGRTERVIDPATEEAIAEVAFGGETEALTAVRAAADAQAAWAALTAYERARVLRRVADDVRDRIDDLAALLTRESGKPLSEAVGEWNSVADLFEWFAEEGKRAYGRTIPARKTGKRLVVLPVPAGVVATITAWNFPAYLPARKWAGALAAGCAVVARPSELTPLSALALAEVLMDAGLPAGVLNVVNGDPQAMGQALLKSPNVDKITFTGSQRVGQILMRGAADGIKRLSLELGGSAPVLVFPDVDVHHAASIAVQAKFRNSGQVCISPTRYYVHEDIRDEFLDACVGEMRTLRLGNGLETGVTTGPLVSGAARDRIEGMVEDAASKGGRIVFGGHRPTAQPRGYFFEPTLVTDVDPRMRLHYEEVFGPVMPVATFKTTEQALKLANDTPYGLAGYALTHDLTTAIQVYEGLKFGIVGVNDLVPATAEGPFGGMKQSGFGREGSMEGLKEFMETKLVSIAL